MSEKSYSQIQRTKSFEPKPFNQTYKYTPRHDEKSIDNKQYNKTYEYPTKCDIKSYPQRQKINYDNPKQDNKSYSKHNNDNKTKQAQPRSVFKYKIERDESGNSRYVLEEPEHNPIKLINYREIVCVYPSNGVKYYKNVNIYNYNIYKPIIIKKIII